MHFSFLPFWLMKSRLWLGALCFKHCLSSHSLFTSDTAHCSGGGFLLCTALPLQLSWFAFILMFCYRMHSFHVLRSVTVRCKEKWDYISRFFFKEVFKATKIHCAERSLQGGGCTLIPSSARIQYLRLAAPRKCIHFKAYRNCSHKFENFF